jgi:integrase/recombinase XerC
MRLEQAIRDFSSHIPAERGLSPQTEYAYRHDLRQLGEFLGWPQLESITPEHLRSWLADQHRKGLSALSLNRRAACLRTFFGYWVRRGGRRPTLAAASRMGAVSMASPIIDKQAIGGYYGQVLLGFVRRLRDVGAGVD